MAISITDDLALLAFDEDKGVPPGHAMAALPHALGATLVFDLQAAGAVDVGEDDLVTVTGAAPNDPVLAEAWQSIRDDAKVRRLRDWIEKPTRLVKGLPNAVYDSLASRGVLEHDGKHRVLRRDRYRELDERVSHDLVAELVAVLDGERAPDGDELLLLALLPVCRLTADVFPDRDHRATEHRIDELLADDGQAADVATRVARSAAAGVAAAVIAGA